MSGIGVEPVADPDANNSQIASPVPAAQGSGAESSKIGGQQNMSLRGFFKELRRRHVLKVAVAYTGIGIVLLEVLTHLFHNFEAPHWVLKVITTLLIVGLPVACLMAWGFEFKEGRVRSVPPEHEHAKPALPAPPAAVPPSIAVLPFEDMSPEQDQKYLGNGIAEELLNALASIDAIKVAARTSSFSLASRGASMKEIGEALHVRHVLEGSVRRSGRKLRVTAQLIDVESGFHLFSQSYDRAAEDIFDIQNEIAREIAAALLPKLGLSKDVVLVKQGTQNLEAYNLWLQGHEYLTSPMPSAARKAIEQLRQAVILDPNYADAWGTLAYVYTYQGVWATDPTPSLANGIDAAAVARTLEPNGVLPLLVQAYVSQIVHHDARASAEYYERARTAGVDLTVWAYNKAYLLDGPLGRYDEAIAVLKEAEQRDPHAPNLQWALMEMYLAAGSIAEAIAIARTQEGSDVPDINILRGLAYLAAGDVTRARAALAAIQAAAGDNFGIAVQLQFAIDAATGDREDARRLLDRMLLEISEGHQVSPYTIGEGYKALGDYERAIDAWTRAAELRATWSLVAMPIRNRNHPVIGKHPRFVELLKHMGLADSAEGTVPG
jgi:TolB-like protein